MPLHPLVERWLPVVAPPVLRVLMSTWRVAISGEEHLGPIGVEETSERIFAIWHGRQVALLALIALGLKRGPMTVMTSASRDGQVQSKILSHFGMTPITGSSSNRGSAALVEMARALRQGGSAVMAADGPVGPVYCAKSGIAALSRMVKRPVIPIGVRCDRAFVLPNTWDEYWIPLPGARVELILGTPIAPPQRGDDSLAMTMNRIQGALAQLNQTEPSSLRIPS